MNDEALPEADRAAGAPHPRETSQLFGQETAEKAFLEAVNSGHLHHAWLLTGPQGIGKATLAWRMARFLLAKAPEDAGMLGDAPAPPASMDISPDHPVAARIAALSEPGCMLIRRAWDADRKRLKAQITVDEVRQLNAFFGLSSTDGGHRVVIVDSVDEMNPSAANAILKVLEEPPKNAVLILISHQPARLLPTIRSRCRTLRLSSLSPDNLSLALSSFDIESTPVLSELAHGSVGEALRLDALGGPEIYGDIIKLLDGAPSMDRQALRAFAEKATARGAEERLALTIRLTDLALVRLARTAAGMPPANDAANGEAEVLMRLGSGADAARKWADLQQELSARIAHGRGVNIDAQSLLVDAFLQINEAAGTKASSLPS
ncbi:MAG: DNA polymerase III subunit delta' [Silicimonas sp.]|nr:DNA polymerase III subunit delta' [Silicimonas sp.]